MTPYFIWMAIFIVVPLLLVFYYAFTDTEGSVTLQNFIEIGKFTSIFIDSILLGLTATIFCLAIGYPMAYIISKADSIKQNTMVMLIMLPMWMNFLLRTYAWMTLLENNGLINRFLGLFGIGPFQMINTKGAVILGMVYNFLPFMIMPIYTVMTKINKSIIEAAQDLGSGNIGILTRIIAPLSIPGVISGITMVFVPSVSTFIISRLLGGSSNLLIGDLIEMQFNGAYYNPNLGSAMAFVLMILIIICMGVMNFFDKDDGEAIAP